MKKLIALILTLICTMGLIGCSHQKKVSPEDDLGTPFNGRWSGIIADIFKEGGGTDWAEVIKVDIIDSEPMYFTITEDTKCLRYFPDRMEFEDITKADLWFGDWVEIDCESNYHSSGYQPILTIKVIMSTQPTLTEEDIAP